jgi:hypothetical protein
MKTASLLLSFIIKSSFMSIIKKIFFTGTVVLSLCVCSTSLSAQKSGEKAAAIKSALDNQHYTFYAQYAQPRQGTQRYLTPDYTLAVSKDSVVSFLPYFGRAYSGTGYGSGDGGIKFTSTQFDYKVTAGKKGSQYISIKPKDADNVSQVTLDVFPGGNCTVTVISVNRDPISFSGYLK